MAKVQNLRPLIRPPKNQKTTFNFNYTYTCTMHNILKYTKM